MNEKWSKKLYRAVKSLNGSHIYITNKKFRKRLVGVSMCVALGLFVVPAIGSVNDAVSGVKVEAAELEDGTASLPKAGHVGSYTELSNAIEYIKSNIGKRYTITLDTDITITKRVALNSAGSEVTIKGNGHRIIFNGEKIEVSNGTLIFGNKDGSSADTDITLTNTEGNSSTNPFLDVRASGAKLKLNSGTEIVSNRGSLNSNSIRVSTYLINIYGATVDIDGAKINGCKAGKIISTGNSSVLNFYSGEISDNIVGGSSSSVIDVSGGSQFNMYGGTIKNNKSFDFSKLVLQHQYDKRYNSNGVVDVSSGTFKMYGGSISGNNDVYSTSTYEGKEFTRFVSTVKLSGSGTFEMYGGEISGNKCTAVYNQGNFNMYNGSIKGNEVNSDSIYKTASGTTNPESAGVFVNNTKAVFNMYGGEISGNTNSVNLGGGIYYRSGNISIYGGTITANQAIKDNRSLYAGAGIYQIHTNTNKIKIESKKENYEEYKDGKLTEAKTDGIIKIAGNTEHGTDSKVERNIFLVKKKDSDALISVGEIFKGSRIGISKMGNFKINSSDSEETKGDMEGKFADTQNDLDKNKELYGSIFFADNSNSFHVGFEDKALWIKLGPAPIVPGEYNNSNDSFMTPEDIVDLDVQFGSLEKPKASEITPAYIKSIRTGGVDRISTSVLTSMKHFTFSDYVIIANAKDYPDALSASVLSKNLESPILLCNPDSLDSRVLSEIERLGAEKIVIVGGESSIGKKVEAALKNSKLDLSIERIAGNDRYDTSVKIAQKVFALTGKKEKIVVASGETFPDSLSAGAYASKNDYPIVLVKKLKLPNSVESFIQNEGPKGAVVVGGTGSVNEEVAGKLDNTISSKHERIAGKDRYETSLLISKDKFADSDKAFLVSGQNFADALVIGEVGGMNNQSIILSSKTGVPTSTKSHLDKNIKYVDVIGGESSLPTNMLINVLK